MAEKPWLQVEGDSIHIEVKVQPGASRTELAGLTNGRLKVRVAAAAEDGKANAELRRFLAAALGCPKGNVTVLRGEKSRLKTLGAPRSCRDRAEALIR
jgi:uncharacterized protein (TIGR00251 family)